MCLAKTVIKDKELNARISLKLIKEETPTIGREIHPARAYHFDDVTV